MDNNNNNNNNNDTFHVGYSGGLCIPICHNLT